MDFLKDLIHTFIPTDKNGYKPTFFQMRSMAIFAIAILSLSFGAYTLERIFVSNHYFLAAVISSALVDLTNGDRSLNGLAMLESSPILERAAQLKAADMAAKGYFAHTSPDGISPWHWFSEAGYSFSFAGENLAVRFTDSVDVERAWMNSPLHRANILNSQFSEIGIATAEGVYQGQPAIFVVQMFGRPTVAEQKKVNTPPQETATSSIPASVASSTTPPSVTPSNIPATSTATLVTEPNPAATSSPVAGTSVQELELTPVTPEAVIIEDSTFIAVRAPSSEVPPVAAASMSEFVYGLFQKIVTSPRTLLNTIYAVLGIIIAVALSLFIGVEIKKQYPKNVFMGVMLIVLMATILFAWQFVSPQSLAIL